MKKILKSLVVIAMVFSVSSCATLLGGSKNNILSVDSDVPIDIKMVSEDGETIRDTTPFTYNLERSNDYTIYVDSDEYRSHAIHISKNLRPLTLFNLFFWPGFIVDYMTGNIYTHKRLYVHIDSRDLRRRKAEAIDKKKNSFTATLDLIIRGEDPDGEPESEVKLRQKVKFKKVKAA